MKQSVLQDPEFMNKEGNTRVYKVIGQVDRIMGDRPVYYNACPECKKKVTPHGDSDWHCEKCQKYMSECNPTYNFTLRVADFYTSVYANVLGD